VKCHERALQEKIERFEAHTFGHLDGEAAVLVSSTPIGCFRHVELTKSNSCVSPYLSRSDARDALGHNNEGEHWNAWEG
jgi:hypothetical protein